MDFKIQFWDMKWEFPKKGMREKSFTDRNKKFRMVAFNDQYVCEDWCTEGHIGYVLKGAMTIDFNGREIEYKAGDLLYIPQGNIHSRHKIKIAAGKKAVIFMVEDFI